MGGRWLSGRGAVLTSLNRWPGGLGRGQGCGVLSQPQPAPPQGASRWACGAPIRGALSGSPPGPSVEWAVSWAQGWEVRDQGTPGPRMAAAAGHQRPELPAAVWAQEQGNDGGAAGRVSAEPAGGVSRGRWGTVGQAVSYVSLGESWGAGARGTRHQPGKACVGWAGVGRGLGRAYWLGWAES